MPMDALTPDKLRQHCDPEALGFKTTQELESVDELVGQDRALGAIRFGTGIDKPGFNLFLLGSSGTGRHTAIRRFLDRRAAEEEAPDDWVYVNNFSFAHKPRALRLPPGTAVRFRDTMAALIDDLRTAIPALFESDDYRNRRRAIDEAFEEQQSSAFEDLQRKAEEKNIAVMRTPMGFALAPKRNGEVIKPEVFNAMAEDERKEIEETIQELQKELADILQRLPQLEKERRDKLRELNAELAEYAVGSSIKDIAARFEGLEAIQTHLEEVRDDLVKNANLFLEAAQEENQQNQPFRSSGTGMDDPRFRRYAVNVVVANGHEDGAKGAPIVFEDHPTLFNLIGRVEHITQYGALTTDFTLIKPGALHRANGGYLVLDARKVLTEPLSWEALKRCLRSGAISITSPGEMMSLVSTISLQPDAIPLKVKVILIGERILYYMLSNLDPDFSDLFKVEADFNEDIDRSEEACGLYSRLVATIVQNKGLKPVEASGVARIIEESSRLADDAAKLSVRTGPLADLMSEADYWAGDAGRDTIAAEDVARAVRERIDRASRLRERAQEAITRDIVLIDTDGEAVGQINGLAVLSLGNLSFGRPSRITARVRMGAGKVVDIEREVELGGPLHSKGVLILSSVLSSRYALELPPSLWASLVFEQSYGGVDGDSASCAELYALLSALSEVPIRQSFAVTGSVNQFGEVQAIGGVNEKIEGFFDLCVARGLTGKQGVLIPKANVQHLMLREDVVDAASKGEFHIYGVETVDQGIALLTGREAGERDASGAFPEQSINALVEAKLQHFAEQRKAFGARPNGAGAGAGNGAGANTTDVQS